MSVKIVDALKSINYKDLAARAAWTFAQGFLAVVLVTLDQIIDLAFAGDTDGLKVIVIATIVGATAAGLSALKTLLLEVTRQLKEDTK